MLEQAAAIRAGELSPVELVEHYLDRIDRYDPELGAFVTVTADAARAAARAAEAAVTAARGADLPPLHGVPIAIKDLTMTAGVRTTFGSVPFADFVPPVDADVVALLRAAGTISLGKTATSEFGVSLYTETRLGPPARNPWSTGNTPGGSSGGAAAAVAAGLIPAGQGSDGGGSLRIPASICGLVGYKPTRGLVSGGPLGAGGFGLPGNGPIGRTVADVAALLDAMAVPVPGEPYPPPAPPAAGSYLAAVRAGVTRPLRIGRHARPALADVPVDGSCLGAWEDACRALAGAGHVVEDVTGPFGPQLLPDFRVLWAVLTDPGLPPERYDELLPLTAWLTRQARDIRAGELVAAQTRLQAAVRRALRDLRGYDLIVTPTLAVPQAPVGSFAALEPAEDFAAQTRMSPFCAVYNLTGQPAISVPLGSTPDGLPVGVMLAGRVGEDATVLAAAAALEAARPWRDRHPAIWREGRSATVMVTSRSLRREGR